MPSNHLLTFQSLQGNHLHTNDNWQISTQRVYLLKMVIKQKLLEVPQQIYFEVLDIVVNAIKNRFKREGCKRHIILENLLLKCAKNESCVDDLKIVVKNYSKFWKGKLSQQLEQFSTACCQIKENHLSWLSDPVKKVNKYEKTHISRVRAFLSWYQCSQQQTQIVYFIATFKVLLACNHWSRSTKSFNDYKYI